MRFFRALPCACLAMLIACVASNAQLAVTPFPSVGSNSFLGATVGTSHAQVAAAAKANRVYVLLHNPSAPGGNTIYCSFGGTAAVAGAGTLSIAPGQYLTLENNFVPSDALDCIASGASTPMTYGVR